MNPEQQRIEIAKACGWNVTNHGVAWGGVLNFEQEGMGATIGEIPDYLNDLNAMHEAEKVLNEAYLWNRYKGWLLTWMTEPICATAAQRAEAFLRTLNLWNP